MAEAKTNRLNLVNEDENLSELISKQAVKEMRRSIKEIERLKEKLTKEFTKKGGKMTEVIDEEMPPSPDKLDLDKAVYGDDAERDPATGDIKKEEVEEEIEEATGVPKKFSYLNDMSSKELEGLKQATNYNKYSPEQKAKLQAAIDKKAEKKLEEEEVNEEVERFKKLAGI